MPLEKRQMTISINAHNTALTGVNNPKHSAMATVASSAGAQALNPLVSASKIACPRFAPKAPRSSSKARPGQPAGNIENSLCIGGS